MNNVAELLLPIAAYQKAAAVPRDMRVSRHSLWDDPVWRLDAVTPGLKDIALVWGFIVAPKIRFTDFQHTGLLEQARRYIWSVRMASQRGRNPKDTSLREYFWALKSLIRWMVKKGLESFAQLTPDLCGQYLSVTSEQLEERGLNTAHLMGAYADTLCRIYEQSVLFKEVPEAIMAVHPFGGMTAYSVGCEYAPKGPIGFIPPVPDPLYLGSMSTAIEWIDVRAPDVLVLQDQHMEARTGVKNRFSSNSYNYRLNSVLSRYRFDGQGTLSTPWRPALSETEALTEFRYLFNDVRDAGIVAVQGALGLRISEVCGIRAGEMSKGTLWPSCITTRPSITGLNELFHLKGRVSKGKDQYEEVAWLVGARPMGSEYIPPAVRAITVLWKLYRPWRELGGREELIVSFPAGNGFPWERESIGRPLSETLGRGQRSWVEANVDIPREYQGWQLSTHQWRKSFAIYMVRSDARLLPAVRDHFKHMSVAMTEGGYLGRDPEMLGMLDDEATYLAAQFLFDAVNGRPAAGKLMETVEENRASIVALIGTEGTEEDRVFNLASLLKEDDIRVWPSAWGNCFFLAERARCHRLAKGDFDQHAKRPHYGQRQPGVCCDCANLLIFSDDVNFWKARFKSALALFKANRAVGEDAAAAVAEDRLHSSASILRRLGIELNWTPDYTATEGVHEFV